MKRIFVGFFLKGLQLIYWFSFLLLNIPYIFKKGVALAKHKQVIEWVKTQEIPLDSSKKLKLPDHLAGISYDGLVQVLHTSDDHYCAVIIIQAHYGITGTKREVKGIFICDVPYRNLRRFSERKDRIDMLGAYQKPYEAAWAFTNLGVYKQYNNCLFEVHR